jgi:hypothetical protein
MIASLLFMVTGGIASCTSTLAFTPITYVQSSPIDRDITFGHSDKKSIRRIGDGVGFAARSVTILRTNSNDEVEGEVDAKKTFWAKQRALAAEMSAKTDAGARREMQEKFARRRLALTSDTFYFSFLIGSLLWLVSPNPFVTISYLFGALSGTAYSYGLGKYVESIGGSIDDTDMEGAGVGQARFAFLILLFVVVGKFRSQGLIEIPCIMGFFTYQLATLSQGLREIED